MAHPELNWLPEAKDRGRQLRAARQLPAAEAWSGLVAIARTRLDFLATEQLDRALSDICAGPDKPDVPHSRLALLSASTEKHLIPGLRVAALRRGIRLHVYSPKFGQYRQELLDKHSGLYAFRPDTVLFAFDWRHLIGSEPTDDGAVAGAIEQMRGFWRIAREQFAAHVIQQTVLNTATPLMGQNEHRLANSPFALVATLNARLRQAADAAGTDLLALDDFAAFDGVSSWHDSRLWHHAKQEITPLAAPVWGDLAARLIAARMGRSAKCIVLDLDNTLWGGVVGDDGVDGIVLGQGNARGEAFTEFQSWLRALSRRGIILAVCSKNDEANALAPFERHPEMVLKRSDIACFLANWDDKPANIRRVAGALNIGMDSLVFVDDNPFERNLVRRELADVAVPEMPDDPSLYVSCIARAGYFEALRLTEDDLRRSAQYQANIERLALQESATDLEGFLSSLDMQLIWSTFDELNRVRLVQLINKTNQFNLTTRRYTDEQVRSLIGNPDVLTLHCRLLDRFGDNGIVGVVIAKPAGNNDEWIIDTWLMSCRVLGRRVEQAMFNLLVELAREKGARTLIGEYRPSARNAMVKDHYAKLGFTPRPGDRWTLSLCEFDSPDVPMITRRFDRDQPGSS